MVKRETTTRMKKVNMVLGTFFSEIGYGLIDRFSHQDKNIAVLRPMLLMDMKWGKKGSAKPCWPYFTLWMN